VTVLVDTSVWVEFLRATGSAHHLWLRDAITLERPLAWTEPILFELTSGAGSGEQATALRSLLLRGPGLPLLGLADWDEAATLCRRARSKGLAVRSTNDCLTASVAIRTGTPLLARDRDFPALASVSDLTLVEPDA
jgi:predicted nucleic acid-binding protein